MALDSLPYGETDTLDAREVQADLLAEAFGSGQAQVVTAALGTIVRARGIARVSREIGITREAIYKATSSEGNPTLATLLGIMRATGFKLSAEVK
jgi:probable addiction module antidote protein